MPQIRPPKAPQLAIAPYDYEWRYQDQLNNISRLYYNQLDGAFRQLFLGFNNFGVFTCTTTQTNAVANAVNLVPFDTTVSGFGISITSGQPTRLEVTAPGVYQFSATIQLDYTSGAATTAYTWFRVNGVDVASSAGKTALANNASNSITTQLYLPTLNAGDYVEFAWSSPSTAVRLLASTASAPVPAIPAVGARAVYLFPAEKGA